MLCRSLPQWLALSGCVTVLIAAEPAQPAQTQPPKKERIALADPKEAAQDPDFAIQGEYEGTNASGKKFGVQVVARGGGKFVVKAIRGGLPGAGGDLNDTLAGTGETKNGQVLITMKRDNETSTATIADGKFTVTYGNQTLTLTKIERKSKTLGEKPPADAVVLFTAPGDEKQWFNGRLYELSDGSFLTVARRLSNGKELRGNITTKEKFGAFKAHIEFRLPWMPHSTGQARGNSGIYLQDRYECQILDSFGLSGENNECGGIYQQHRPLVNMCLPPMVWQTYDIEFTPAQFDATGQKTKNARVTIYHNGVKIHDNVELAKETPGGKKEEPTPGPLQFQDHGDPVVFRNVWVVPVK
ncbi:MAG: DUF1080 domain-containing protein [Gemmataceae bacterium]|nr:DUF1080 domain-containing protein [Gemmata sp.]MDW8198042.1 DUF1080 domain-containing protein [Gemmataceae bacterium]